MVGLQDVDGVLQKPHITSRELLLFFVLPIFIVTVSRAYLKITLYRTGLLTVIPA